MNHSKIILSLIFVVFTINSFSQTKDSTRVFIYEPFKSGQTIDPKKDIKVNKNCIKWNWSLLARGVFAFNYERLISSQLSYELGAGLTYRDYMYELGQGNDDFIDGSSKVSLGKFMEGSLRFYPKEGDLEGFFVSPFIRFRNYNIETILEDINYSAGYKMTDIGFNIGVQREAWYTGIMVESYFGVAYSYRVADQPYVDNNGTTSLVIQNKSNKWIPIFTLGFKIGLPF